MLWPTPADYAQAVGGYPDVCLLDPKLRGGKPKKTPTNEPLIYTGGFSTVFPIEVSHNNYALRCWNKDIGDSKNRYEKIDDYLKQVRLPYFVDFKYVPEGILINGKKWPITRMEWADGESLRDFIEHNLHDPNIFTVVADKFRKMFETLHVNKISHGDLQDGNIMLIKSGTDIIIKLIDYDSLFVPSLRGQNSPTPGLPEYQHPSRSDKCDEKMDYFSELVIYLSFLSLSEKPELWNQFKDKTEKCLLFSKQDFENPDQSDIFKELENLSSDVQNLASTLKQFCAKTSIDDLEPLETILPKHDAKFYTDQGQNHINKSRYNDAISEFQKAIILNPNYEKALYGLGLSYLHCNRYNEAINACEQVIYIEPNYKEAYLVLGFAHLKSGNNSKATIAANKALKIDPYYQPAKQLLDAIKNPPIPPDPPDPPNPPDPSPDFWQSFIRTLGKNWQSIMAGTLAIGLIICLIAFLTQMNAKGNALTQNTGLKNQLAQKDTEIESLTTSVATLKEDNSALDSENKKLREDMKKLESAGGVKSIDMNYLEKQVSDYKNRNQKLLGMLQEKDTEIKQLKHEKSDVLNTKRGLESRLGQKNLEVSRLNVRLRNIQKENTKLQSEKLRLQTEKRDLTQLNKKLNAEITSLQKQLNNSKQNDLNSIVGPNPPNITKDENLIILEPPKEIDAHKDIATLASTNYNNSGFKAFYRKEYEIAVNYFKQAVLADSNFALSHYNLGCVYVIKQEYPNAIIALSKAIKLNPRFEKAYYNRSLAYFRSRRFKEAKQDVEKAISINRNYQRAHNLLEAVEKSVK